ncbi:MAG: ATP-dependent Clp protease ATP-binding subunit ClpC, partial [Gemmatimonadaceae bacterium]|nr:ATP-dependent Clp protease ATP-binding subunit ClpC [Gloeobacterales cyanobacterium ES-bin-141]
MFEKFTEKAIRAIMQSQKETRRLGHNIVRDEHILLGLIAEGRSIAARALKAVGVNLRNARLEVEKVAGRGPGLKTVEIPFTPNAARSLEVAVAESERLGDTRIS